MSNHTEIRWHGRGGQGAKTAALLLADVAFKTGKYVQGFPEYGPERMGACLCTSGFNTADFADRKGCQFCKLFLGQSLRLSCLAQT